MRILIILLLVALLAIFPVMAETPKRIKSSKSLKNEQGAVLLSVRSQAVSSNKLRIWFLREGGDENNDMDVLEFSRKQGFGGPSMIMSLPKAYSLNPGRYQLFAHMDGCMGPPVEGQVCTTTVAGSGSSPNPTARYDGEVPAFTVEAGKLTNAGEFILEWPLQPKFSFNKALVQALDAKVRWKSLPLSSAKKLKALPKGPSPIIPKDYLSKITCENLKTGFIKPLVYAFRC